MKKFCFLSFVACACLSIVFTGCNKDDDGPGNSSITSINAKVEKGTNYDFDKVKAVMYHDRGEYVAAEGNYTNGGFNLQLPETVNQEYLYPLGDNLDEIGELEGFGITGWLKISDKNVNAGIVYIEAYKSNSYKGDFYYVSLTENESLTSYTMKASDASFVYVDKDVQMTGSLSETETIDGIKVQVKVSANAALKKGWNILFLTMDVSVKASNENLTMSITSKNPGGLKWYYDEDAPDIDFFAVSGLKSSQPEGAASLSDDMKKLMSSKYSFFPRTKK